MKEFPISAQTLKQMSWLGWTALSAWAMFLASDLILAIGMFGGSFPFRSEAVWLTYGPGQMLIVISAWLVATHTESLSTNRHYSGDHDKCTTIQS